MWTPHKQLIVCNHMSPGETLSERKNAWGLYGTSKAGPLLLSTTRLWVVPRLVLWPAVPLSDPLKRLSTWTTSAVSCCSRALRAVEVSCNCARNFTASRDDRPAAKSRRWRSVRFCSRSFLEALWDYGKREKC